MRIAYVSTLKNSAWGGSEELWFQSALVTGKEHHLGIFIYDWKEEPEKIKVLRDNGAVIYKRPRSVIFVKRLLRFVFGRLHFLGPYHPLKKFDPDVIIVTDGNTYYAANDRDLCEVLFDFKNKYVIICQANAQYFFPSNREKAIFLFENSKQVVFVAEKNRVQTFHQLARKISNTVVIQNPVNVNSFELQPFPTFLDGRINFAIIGRLNVSDKGQDMLIELMSDPFWLDVNLKIHIYGDGSDKDYLIQLIEYYGVSHKVELMNFCSINEIWSKCHCLLMPSIFEGTPLALLEAMVIGRVCIVTDVGGNAEWISDGQNGFLIEAPTKYLVDKKMKEALKQLDNWPQIAMAAHQSSMSKLDKSPGKTLFDMCIAD